MKNLPPKSDRDFQKRFRDWFEVWGRDLWALSAQISTSPSMAEEDFLEVLDILRRKMRARPKKILGDRGAALFIREWQKMHLARDTSAENHLWGVSEEERILLAMLFRLKWSIEKISSILGLSTNSIRFRCFQSLKRIVAGEKGSAPKGRDCVRTDLFLPDVILGLEWSDPLNLFTQKDLQAHLATCSRCSHIKEHSDEWIVANFSERASLLPKRALEFVESEPNLTSRWILLTWISTWPWFVRLPLQFAFAGLVVFVVVSVPYLGDFFPNLRNPWPEVRDRVAQWIPDRSQLPELPTHPQFAKNSEAPAPLETIQDEVPPPAPAEPPPPPVVAVVPPPLPPPVVAIVTPPAPPAVKLPPPAAAKAEILGPKTFYQWTALSSSFDPDSERVKALLLKYAAESAGSLAFGASYRGGHYFHFNINDGDYEKFLSDVEALELEKFSKVKSQGIKIRPPGKTRIVFLLKPKGGQKKGEPTSAPTTEEESNSDASSGE